MQDHSNTWAAPPSIARVLAHLQERGLDRLDAQLLLLHALSRAPSDRAWLVAHDSDLVSPDAGNRLDALASRRLDGEPVAYLTGHKEFYGLALAVDARVLVPRPDTETLVDWALEVLAHRPTARVMDLGTGSGAIALALKHTRPRWQLHARDFSTDALNVAVGNGERLRLEVRFSHGSWLSGVQETFDAIVCNPPYIAPHDPHLAALKHEPLRALASGGGGLDALRTVVSQAPANLVPGGWLLLEHGYDQGPPVRTLLRDAGFSPIDHRQDLAGLTRCTGGQFK
jgi:release factor glutamine methyltransferase